MLELNGKELFKVLHSFQKDKSLGPNGWKIEFFLGCFEILGTDLRLVVNESKQAGCIHIPFNATFLALILKSDELTSLDKYM